MSSSREWLLLTALVFTGPLVCLGLIEGGLRLAGAGYPSEFFLRTGEGHATNEKYGWRLFPRAIARTPNPESLPEPETKRRVFVLGESAAMGFPDPAFGLPAFLQSALGREWRVTNAAMTAINSHSVREIAFECALLKPYAFIIYMGNNEIVGPYGPGTVFGPFSGNLAVIRAQLWAKSLRAGELLSAFATRSQIASSEWRGLEFFVHSQIPGSDPRLPRVYHHFRDNLRQIVRAGQRAGARVFISTVAVNLVDCPPFASPDGAAQRAFDNGAYSQARDLDALRFRADSRINAIIREVALAEKATLIDAERFIEPTNANFWEHVHLRPQANRRLAEWIASALTGEPRSAKLQVTAWDEHRLTRTILAIMERPPFTAAHRQKVTLPTRQAAPAEARKAWEQRVEYNADDLVARERLAELDLELRDFQAAESAYRILLAHLPLRSWRTGLAESLLNQGRFSEAEQSYRSALALDNRFAPAYVGLGVTRAAQNDIAAAESDFRRAIALQPRLAEAHNSLGRVLQSRNNLAEAATQYQLAIDARPGLAVARYNLAGVLARLNNSSEAIKQLELAIATQPDFAPAHYDLGLLLAGRGQFEAAIQHYAESLRLNPRNADALNNWGAVLARQSRSAEARRKFKAALAVDPGHSAARRNLELLEQP
jgi:tetratricopeptide (TPR) repeat protein